MPGSPQSPTSPASPPSIKKGPLIAWALYDWANSAFPTVIITFVFAAYFTKGVAADVATGSAQWGYAISLSALAVAVLGPVLGAIADHGGRRKPWILAFCLLCIGASALLWTVLPGPEYAIRALVLVAVANLAFEMGMVFYNSMLPGLAPKSMTGRVSGWGWGLGYGGGLACLGLALAGLVQADSPWFGLDKEAAEHLRATGPMVALWFGVFAIPLFLFTPDAPATGLRAAEAVRRGLGALFRTLRDIRANAGIGRYLLARMIYTDGLNTLFAFGGIYAVGTFAMGFEELILFGIALNVTAGLGAAAFAWVDDWIGPKRTIVISVAALAVLGTAMLVAPSKTWFWIFGIPLGVFVGPAQAASRSMMAHMAPKHMETEMFGLYALSGKATAFLGPAAFGLVTAATGSQRWGMATIIVFFVVGLLLLRGVPDARK